MKKITLLFLILVFSKSFSQDDYTINFQDELINLPENIASFQFDQLDATTQIQNGYYTWVQFFETPTQGIQNEIKASRIQLIEYINNKTYLAFIPNNISTSFLSNQGIRSIVPVDGSYKLSPDLKSGNIGDWAINGNNLLVTLQFHDAVTSTFVITQLQNKQISVAQEWKGSRNIDLEIPNNCLDELAALPYVKWVEVIHAPSVKDDVLGRTLHRSSGLDTQTSAGRNYTGAGIGVMVRDDGIVGPHIDFQGRIDNSSTSGSGQTHGDGVGGIMAGAGNLNPKNRGMATGADVYVVNYVPSHLDGATQSLINNGTVQITNSSYSDGCNAGYTTITQTVDQQINNLPSLLHVFSAGNSNNNDCGYGAGNQWGNITGGHKQGKNVIATANVFFNGTLVTSSSRGPAHDGRIKPDIAANGQNQISTAENNTYQSFGGTSGAAPGIAGISAQLYELYGELNGGALPESALIKAALLNTANDAGNVGPDFRFGWGIVNALQAGKLLEDNRYLSDEITQGETNTHTINIPNGTTQVRFMVYWRDVAASPGTSAALVNDLDLVVSPPSGGELLPWILDPTPNPTTLNAPATNGEDHLNNMEQVLINDPEAGNYTIDISGFDIPFGPQEYFVVYEIIQENLTLTYPNDGESLVPGESEVIHWDAVNTTESFVLEYSNDNGSTWNSIATVPATTDFRIWTVPQDVTGEALVRVTSGAFSDESDGNFSIASLVNGITLTSACALQASFEWNAVPDAEGYDFYVLGEKYMELVGSSATNSITVPIESPDNIWYAVAATNTTAGWTGMRSIAQFYSGGQFNCNTGDATIECPEDIIVDNDPEECGAIVIFDDAEAFDGEGNPLTVTQTEGLTSGSFFPIGETTIQFLATDPETNIDIICNFTITVQNEDFGSPDTFIGDYGIEQLVPSIFGYDTFSFGDGITFLTLFSEFTDASQIVPGIPLSNSQRSFDADYLASLGFDNTSTFIMEFICNGGVTLVEGIDDTNQSGLTCGNGGIVFGATDGGSFDIDNDEFILVFQDDATDDCGTGGAFPEIRFFRSPVITCLEDITVNNDPGECGAIVTFDDVTAIDIDGNALEVNLVLGDPSGSLFPVGDTIVEFSATSLINGETVSCSFTVTVIDTETPEIECPDDVVINAEVGETTVEIPDFTADAVAVDNCIDSVTVTQNPVAGTIINVGTAITVTLTASDDFDNEATCTFEVMADIPLGLEDLVLDGSITLYPNPTQGPITLSNQDNVTLTEITIFDINGRIIQTLDVSDNVSSVIEFSLSEYRSGVYFARINSDTGSIIRRIVKQ